MSQSLRPIPRRLIRPLLAATAASACLGLGGCLVGVGSSVDTFGTEIGAGVLKTITPGETTEAWLLATLGEPSRTTEVADQSGVKVLRYDYTIEEDSGGYVFLLFAAGSEKRRTTRTFFEVRDGIVTQYWSDGGA